MRRSVVIDIPPEAKAVIEVEAELSALGGVSHVRGEDRMERLMQDQMTGRAGEMAFYRWLFGSWSLAIIEYEAFRSRSNAEMGDDTDVPGWYVDVKASRLDPQAKRHWSDYSLLIRPHERHDDMTYVAAIVRADYERVLLPGWILDSDLPPTTVGGIFDGAHVVSLSSTIELPRFQVTTGVSTVTWPSN